MHSKDYYKELRNKYLPEKLKVVFVLESPPASGKYFYDPNGSKGELLFRMMMKLINYKPETKIEGLKEFSNKGYFLVDSTYEQVNKTTDKRKRNLTIIKNIPDLINDLTNLIGKKRIKIIPIQKNVCQILSGPLESVGLKVINKNIPFPDPSQQKQFFDKIEDLKKGLIL